MGRLAALATGRRSRWVVIAAWLVLAAALAPLQPQLSDKAADENEAFVSATAESTRVDDLLDERVRARPRASRRRSSTTARGARSTRPTSSGSTPTPARCATRARSATCASVITPTGVACGETPGDSLAPETPPSSVSDDGSTHLVTVLTTDENTDVVVDDVLALRERLPGPDGERPADRTSPARRASPRTRARRSRASTGTLLAITLALVLVLLLATYRSPVVALVPLVVVGARVR